MAHTNVSLRGESIIINKGILITPCHAIRNGLLLNHLLEVNYFDL